MIPFGAVAVILARRWRAATPPQRRAIAPVVWTGGVALVVSGVANGLDAAGARQDAVDVLEQLALAAVPFGFLAGLLRSRLVQAGAVSELVARLGQSPDPAALRAALAEALGDPSLRLAYWLPDAERFVDADGRTVRTTEGTWTEVELHGSRIAAIGHDASLADEPQLVRAAGGAAALAIENQRLSAALRARIEELRASRARLVEAGDAERRRLERDLHDGAQSRLVALAIRLRLARRRAEDDSELAALLDESSAELQASLDEVRELARGIHPAVLTDRGLDAALPEPRRARAGAGRDRRRRARRPPRRRRHRDLLRRRGGADERRQVRVGDARDGRRRAHGRSACASRSPTTASAARTSRPAPGCAGSPTASARSTAGSSSTARAAAARASGRTSRSRDRGAGSAGGPRLERAEQVVHRGVARRQRREPVGALDRRQHGRRVVLGVVDREARAQARVDHERGDPGARAHRVVPARACRPAPAG